MSTSLNLLQRQAETLELAASHWKANRKTKATKQALTVALAREAGADGATVALEVGKRLGWPVYDHQLLERIAQEMGLRTQLLESVDERIKSWPLECMEGFVGSESVSEMAYIRQLMQTIYSLGAHGDCVIVGRGAAQFLPPKTTLRVRLVRAVEDRIAAISRRLQLPKEKAAKWVADTDRQRQRFVKDHFLKDPTDPHNYDLILNTSRWSTADCADLILQGLKNLALSSSAEK
jgi:cytidylate kinase